MNSLLAYFINSPRTKNLLHTKRYLNYIRHKRERGGGGGGGREREREKGEIWGSKVGGEWGKEREGGGGGGERRQREKEDGGWGGDGSMESYQFCAGSSGAAEH